MTQPRFVQVHWLASYPSALLNRDDAGLAKRMPFGGVSRGRISSQCLKRHWRFAGEASHEAAKRHPFALQNLGIPMGERTKEVVERRIMPAATAQVSALPERVTAVQEALIKHLYGDKAGDKKARQALFFGHPEIAYLAQQAAAALAAETDKAAVEAIKTFGRSERANLAQMKRDAGLESALFGRMVTSDRAANRDAAIHVAHAMTVHELERELDYMSVVEDLKDSAQGDDAGAAGVFDMELVSGVYYGYAVVDVPLLVENLSGDSQAAAQVVEYLIHLIATVSPGAKKGSTAPYAYAEHVLVEVGDAQPRTLANAFREAIPLEGDILARAVASLGRHLEAFDLAYGAGPSRRQVAVGPNRVTGIEATSLAEAARWARECLVA
jgi:CRISPR system Cascade subunit CasC